MILIELVMPEAEGTELMQWLADRRCTAQVIVTTGYNRTYAETAARLGRSQGFGLGRSNSTLRAAP